MENFERFDLTEVTDEFVNEVIPIAEELNLTVAQIKVLALLKYISRIDKKDEDGYFFVENDFIRKVCGIGSKSTLNNAFGVLIESGYIDRISSSRIGKASKYRVHLCTPKVYTGKVIDNQVVIENKVDKCTRNCTHKCTIDTDIDKELDIEKEKDIYIIIINKINNIIKENNNNLINIIEEKENNIINIIKEKELQQQINELKEQNEILTSRLNNCGRQFKAMMNTMRELQQQINRLKENKTSTAFCGDAVKEVKKEETIPTVEGRKDKEEIKTIDVEVKPSTAFCDAADAKKELSPIEELNETFDVEAIVEEFKKSYTDVEEVQAKQVELIKAFKKAGLNYYNRCELEHRISKYIKSLSLINSTVQEEVPQEVQEPIEEEVKETIPTMEVEVITSRKEEEESTFVDNFQANEGDSDASDERLRYQDIKTKTYYKTLEEAQAAEVNPMYLYDYEVSRCVSFY